MKTFDLFKHCKKNFSIKKYIKPTYNQEYYNSLHVNRYRDKVTLYSIINNYNFSYNRKNQFRTHQGNLYSQ